MAALDTPPPPGSERYPGFRGNEEVSLAELRDLRQKGEMLSEAYAVIYSRFSYKAGLPIVSEERSGYCADICSQAQGNRVIHGKQPRACVHESQRARNQLALAPSRIVLTHSLLSASD